MTEEEQRKTAQLAAQLAEGFAALSSEYQALFDQQRQLESKLSWAKQQYLDLLRRLAPTTLSQDHIAFLQDLERVGGELPQSRINVVEQLACSDDVERKGRALVIRKAEEATLQMHMTNGETGVKIWSGPSADNSIILSESQKDTVKSPLEKDFTIAGTPSKLGCPFAATASRRSPLATPRSSTSRLSQRGRRSHRASFNDPIRAEICGNDITSITPSVAASGSAAVCPIRFMDQHDPEEVAKYFEKHKHELPRSHEVCITRFQSNAESIEQLDKKYGNLVNMIQGLGQKHQAWLPDEPEDAIEHTLGVTSGASADAKADAKVQRWATAVSASLQEGTPPPEESGPEGQDPDEARTAHFDRPLKEVRVGESPSRPWGITIPAKYTNADSSSSVGSVPTASPHLPTEHGLTTGENPQRASKCPFDHQALVGQASIQPDATSVPQPPQEAQHITVQPSPPQEPQPPSRVPSPQERDKDTGATNVVPQMIFNGPVFLGYPPEQLIALLQNSNLGATMR